MSLYYGTLHMLAIWDLGYKIFLFPFFNSPFSGTFIVSTFLKPHFLYGPSSFRLPILVRIRSSDLLYFTEHEPNHYPPLGGRKYSAGRRLQK